MPWVGGEEDSVECIGIISAGRGVGRLPMSAIKIPVGSLQCM